MPNDQEVALRMQALAQGLVEVMPPLGERTFLDYSEQSVTRLDAMIEELWPDKRPWRRGKPDKGSANVMAPSIGAYLGEVMVRNLGGRWEMNDEFETPAVVIGRFVAFPIARAFKRFSEGRSASLIEFYEGARERAEA